MCSSVRFIDPSTNLEKLCPNLPYPNRELIEKYDQGKVTFFGRNCLYLLPLYKIHLSKSKLKQSHILAQVATSNTQAVRYSNSPNTRRQSRARAHLGTGSQGAPTHTRDLTAART